MFLSFFFLRFVFVSEFRLNLDKSRISAPIYFPLKNKLLIKYLFKKYQTQIQSISRITIT